MSPKYLFVGNMVLDDIVYPDGRTRMAVPGGNGLYATMGAKIWNDDIGLVASVGRDWPEQFTELLRGHHIALDALTVLNAETMRNWILYEHNGHRTYVSRNSTVVQLTPTPYTSIPHTIEDVRSFNRAAQQVQLQMSPKPVDLPANYWHATAFHLSPMRLQATLDWGAAIKNNSSALVTTDILPYSVSGNLNNRHLLSLLAHTSIFMPSKFEANYLHNDANCLDLCRQLAQRGPKVVVIKKGNAGSFVYDHDTKSWQKIPIYPTEAVDLTGAGDSYCGGFVIGYIRSGDPFEAALYGTVSASFLIEDFGALHALAITRTQAEKRLAKLKHIVAQESAHVA